ncbi:MAG: hypothetical protein HDQ88_12270 [Clostridia bacterium]|nr:hypothetical protein [Clostridia bacterium]
MSDYNQNPERKSEWSYPEKWGFTIIGVLIIGAIALLVGYFFMKGHAPESHHIHFVLTYDTIQHTVKDLYTRAEVDSLVTTLQSHEALLEQKYQYILNQHEEEDRMRMWVTIIVGLILSIAGFFGFKNISELKKQCREDASSIASGVATSTAETVAEKKAEEKANEVATKVAEKETAKIAKDICETKASDIAQETAESITREYLNLNLKKTVNAQLDYIQESTVFQNLKKENETVIRLGIEKIIALIPQTSSTQSYAEENHERVEPEINLEIPNED